MSVNVVSVNVTVFKKHFPRYEIGFYTILSYSVYYAVMHYYNTKKKKYYIQNINSRYSRVIRVTHFNESRNYREVSYRK